MDNQDTELVSFSFTSGSPNSSSCTEGGESSMPSPVTIFPEISGDQFESQRQFNTLEVQRLIETYNDAFCRLHHTVGYADSLRKENLLLATEKLRLLSLVQEQERSSVPPFTEITSSSSNIVAGYDGHLRQNLEAERSEEPNPDGEANTGECIPNRPSNVLPKSISIRSCDFLAARPLSPRDRMSFIRGRHPFRPRLPENVGGLEVEAYPLSPRDRMSFIRGRDRMSFIRGPRLPAPSSLQENVGLVEVEAYNQGMTKTELCKKCEQMGIGPCAERFAGSSGRSSPTVQNAALPLAQQQWRLPPRPPLPRLRQSAFPSR